MSPVNTFSTGVPSTQLVPGTFHIFNYLRAAGSLASVPLTIALIGEKTAAGTAVAGTIYDATNAATTDALGGASGGGALMCRKAYEAANLFGRAPIIKVVFVAEPGGGTANVKTITAVGTATAQGNQIIRIAGRTFVIGVRVGDTATINGAAISDTFKSKAETLPVIVSVAAGIVTLTHATKGVNGIDVKVTVEQQVAGIVLTVANTVVGAGVADHQPAFDALAPQRYDGIALANHAAADITEILTDINTRWASDSKNWGWYFVGEPGTIGTATALAAAANHQSTIICNMEGCLDLAGEMATVGAMLVFSRERPNAGYDNATVPLHPPASALLYTGPEKNTAIAAGLTVFDGVKDATGSLSVDRSRCIQLVTSKTVSTGPSGSAPDDRNRDIAVSRTGVALAIQLDVAINEALGPDRNPDGVNQDPDTDKLILDVGAAILRAEARASPPVLNRDFVEQDVANLLLEHDSAVLGRDNVRIPYHPNNPLHQVAWVHDVIIGA